MRTIWPYLDVTCYFQTRLSWPSCSPSCSRERWSGCLSPACHRSRWLCSAYCLARCRIGLFRSSHLSASSISLPPAAFRRRNYPCQGAAYCSSQLPMFWSCLRGLEAPLAALADSNSPRKSCLENLAPFSGGRAVAAATCHSNTSEWGHRLVRFVRASQFVGEITTFRLPFRIRFLLQATRILSDSRVRERIDLYCWSVIGAVYQDPLPAAAAGALKRIGRHFPDSAGPKNLPIVSRSISFLFNLTGNW